MPPSLHSGYRGGMSGCLLMLDGWGCATVVLLCISSARQLITMRLRAWLRENLAAWAAPMKT